MRFTAAALAAVFLMSGAASAQVAAPPVGTVQQPPPGTPAPPPGTPAPAAPAPGTAVPVVPAPVIPVQPLGTRTFTAPAGLIFSTVRPDRVVDFEMVMGYLQAAFEKSTDQRVREQAKGWRVFKVTEPGPNNSVMYVFVIDPAIPGAEYGLGRILADAYPDQIQEIWKLYTGSLAPSATLLNLSPLKPAPLLTPPSAVPVTPPAASPSPAPPAGP